MSGTEIGAVIVDVITHNGVKYPIAIWDGSLWVCVDKGIRVAHRPGHIQSSCEARVMRTAD